MYQKRVTLKLMLYVHYEFIKIKRQYTSLNIKFFLSRRFYLCFHKYLCFRLLLDKQP